LKINPLILLTVSDIFTNLSAGWFGAAFIVPLASDKPPTFNLLVLFLDVFFGIVFFIAAYRLRKSAAKRGKK